MKVLDPFSGYRLASGHPIFHMSLFAGSFITKQYAESGTSIEDYDGYLGTCFVTLRWSHLALFIFATLSFFVSQDSAIEEPLDKSKISE